MRRKGFTLLELVTAMAIIAILIALLVVGVDRVVASNKVKQTHIMLQDCRNLVAEMEVNSGLNQQPAAMFLSGNGSATAYDTTTANYDLWHAYKYSDYTGKTGTYGALPSASAFGTTGGVFSGSNDRYNSDAVLNTRLAMAILLQVPNNKTALSSIPANQIMKDPPASVAVPTLPKDAKLGPVILDGFGNPIILVPAAGIQVAVTDPTDPSKVVMKIIRAPDNRPFWASAGADGFFTDVNGQKAYGEDNIYSFEQ